MQKPIKPLKPRTPDWDFIIVRPNAIQNIKNYIENLEEYYKHLVKYKKLKKDYKYFKRRKKEIAEYMKSCHGIQNQMDENQ